MFVSVTLVLEMPAAEGIVINLYEYHTFIDLSSHLKSGKNLFTGRSVQEAVISFHTWKFNQCAKISEESHVGEKKVYKHILQLIIGCSQVTRSMTSLVNSV